VEYLYGIKKAATDEELKGEWCLKFDVSSIKYIIVKNVDELIHLFDAIDNMDDKYSSDQRKLLKT
jgi:hypothetical protein